VVNWQLALTAAVAMPPIAVLTYFFAHRVFPISREVQRKKGHLTEASDEAVVGIEMVQAFGREDDVRDRFSDRAEAVRHETMRQASVEARFLPGLVFLPTLGIAAVLLVGGREAIAGNLTIGQFTLFITLLLQLVWPLEALGWIINLGQRATAAASRSFAWLDGIESLPEPEQPVSRPDRRRQDVAPEPAPTLLRPHRGPRPDRRGRRARRLPRRAAQGDRDRDAEGRALLRAAAGQPARSAAGRGLGRRARRVRGGGGRRVRRRPARRLRHADRRARRQPLGRPASAGRPRAGAHRRLARARARRPDVRRGHGDGAPPGREPPPRRRREDRAHLRAAPLDRPRRRSRDRAPRGKDRRTGPP